MMRKKRYAYVILGLIILFSITIFTVYALVTATGSGHPYSEILVTINGYNVTLQQAIDNEWLKGINQPTFSTLSSIPNPGHSASEVIVAINGYEVTLQDAINQNYFKGTGTISSSSSAPFQGHPATEIEVTVNSVKKSLQDALPEIAYACAANYGQSCPSGDASCINPGTIQCDGTCSGSYKSKGTSCTSDDWHACDGEGSCLGWKGYGCGSCPFGFTQFACCPGGERYCATGWVCGACKNLGIYRGYPDYHTGGWALSSPICGVAKPSQYVVISNDWKMKP
jgi:hypothetical protein